MAKLYNENEVRSIESHGKALLKAGTLRKARCEIKLPIKDLLSVVGAKSKSSFGKLLEQNYYGIQPGNSPEPDFREAGVELKSTPLLSRAGIFQAKERLVLNIINYRAEAEKNFTQSILKKNATIMLVSYEHADGRPSVDHPVRIAQLIKFKELPAKDRKIIEGDWKILHDKIIAGRAHEISEGDTLYLAACTKGTDGSSMTIQFNNSIKAKCRAFSLKSSYMTAMSRRILHPKELSLHEPILRDASRLARKSFESIVKEKFERFIGRSEKHIRAVVGRGLNVHAKDYLAQLSRRMIGIKGKRIEEFEKAGIIMKTVQLLPTGKPKEETSFPYFSFKGLAKEKWDGDPDKGETRAQLQIDLEKKFLFIVFQRNDAGERNLKDVFFWNMPSHDLTKVESVWKTSQKNIAESKLAFLPKISDDVIIHVRPHGRNKKDTDQLPNGKRATKRCFWLNRVYIQKVIENA